MDKYKILSGDEIVAKGATKVEVTLPEIGLKDVAPNDSWLEQKQIQSALEARKHLVEALRIEKSGVLTHAEWRDDLKLAEIKNQAGGYWQFMGHHKNYKLYLRPEEALFLIEVNCLLLRYNEVIVSLQQAYSLLLTDDISKMQYRVYASLSRLGYKVLRHLVKPPCEEAENITEETTITLSDNDKADKVVSEQTSSDNGNEKDPESKTNVTEKVEVKEQIISNDNNNQSNIDITGVEENSMSLDLNKVESSQETPMELENKTTEPDAIMKEDSIVPKDTNTQDIKLGVIENENNLHESNAMEIEQNSVIEDEKGELEDKSEQVEKISTDDNELSENTHNSNEKQEKVVNTSTNNSMEIDCDKETPVRQDTVQDKSRDNSITERPSQSPGQSNMTSIDPLTKYCQWKLEKLKTRQSRVTKTLDVHKYFKDCPDMLENQIVTVNTPKEEYLPKNVFLNNLSYIINVENVKTKNAASPTSAESTYSLSDEVNGAHVRRVTNVSNQLQNTPIRTTTQTNQNTSFPQFFPAFRPNVPFRHNNFWRPRPHNMSYYQFNLFFQRPFMSNYHPRFQFFPRMHMPMFPRPPMNFTENNEFRDLPNNTRKRPKNYAKISHLENIKNLVLRLKNFLAPGNIRNQNIQAIQSLIQTYNMRFRTRFRLSEEFELVNDETIVETITLDDDDEERRAKRPRIEGEPDLFVENFNKIRQASLKLKQLQAENKSTARHRRALSSVIKTFNKHFNADIHMTENYDVINRRHINLDSSSDSDCVVEERPKVAKGKKLRNPFNILKKLSEKQSCSSSPTASRQGITEANLPLNSHAELQNAFEKPWLPDENGFGSPEITPRDTMTARFIETKKEEFLLDFLKGQPYKFNNWIDIKIAFLESIEETNAILHTEAMIESNVDIKSLVKSEDCTDMATVLNKLDIIKSNASTLTESSLSIDYDVYNRDVKNFRKSDRPKPHFRIICINESSTFPSGADIATLHASVGDDAALIFAVVGPSSVSYVQLNPTKLPVYRPCNDLG